MIPRIGKFIPTMQPTFATFDEVIELHGGRTFAEVKYDGFRVQVHKNPRGFRIYTRNGKELNYDCFPDVTKIARNLPNCIIDAELVGEGDSHKEVYQNVLKRFRRDGISQEAVDAYIKSGIIGKVPLSLRVFDTLRFEDEGLIGLPQKERRAYTERFDAKGIMPSQGELVTDSSALEALVKGTFELREEGRVCKDPDSPYLSGKKAAEWVKFKRHETLDLVIVGFYKDTTGQDLPFSAVLCASYNDSKETYETIGKVSVVRNGLAREIDSQVRDYMKRDLLPRQTALSEKLGKRAYMKHMPDWYIDPATSVVLEVKALNINRSANWQTCGLGKDGKAFSLRIGYAERIRYDKRPVDATSTGTIAKLYSLQGRDE